MFGQFSDAPVLRTIFGQSSACSFSDIGRTWTHFFLKLTPLITTSDFCHWIFNFQLSYEVTDPMLTYSGQIGVCVYVCGGLHKVLRPNTWLIFNTDVFVVSLERFRCQSGSMTLFVLRFSEWGWRCSFLECRLSELLVKIPYDTPFSSELSGEHAGAMTYVELILVLQLIFLFLWICKIGKIRVLENLIFDLHTWVRYWAMIKKTHEQSWEHSVFFR